MATTEVSRPADHARGRAPKTAALIILGIVGGGVLVYAAAVVGTAPMPGEYTTNPLALLLLAALAAVAVVAGWQWPVVGLSAAAAIGMIVAFAVSNRIGWSSASDWLDPFAAVGYGAVSAYPAMIGAAVLTASFLRLRANRSR